MSQQVAAQRGGSSPFPCDRSCATLNFVSTESDLQNKGKVSSAFFFFFPFSSCLVFLWPCELRWLIGGSEKCQSSREEPVSHAQGKEHDHPLYWSSVSQMKRCCAFLKHIFQWLPLIRESIKPLIWKFWSFYEIWFYYEVVSAKWQHC